MDSDLFEEKLTESIKRAVTSIARPTLEALKNASESETGNAKVQLEAMVKAVELGMRKKVPVCQDTGTPTFFVKVGKSFSSSDILCQIKESIKNSVERATDQVPLRPNTVHPISGENPGNNIGRHIPYIEWSICEGDAVDIFFLPKGGGSENMSQLNMMSPGEGLAGVKNIVLERIASMGGKPCPPTIIGLGLGGGSNIAMNLAKEALLRPVGENHEEEDISELERELKDSANQLGVGPMGVGGKTTVLDVHVEYAYRHPASYPVGIVVQCWANRRGFVTIHSDGSVEVKY